MLITLYLITLLFWLGVASLFHPSPAAMLFIAAFVTVDFWWIIRFLQGAHE